MKIDITGRHFHVTDPLRVYTDEKIGKLDKYSLKLEAAHVIFDVQKFMHFSEIVLRGKRMRLTAKAASTDMYSAFDKSFDSIRLQLERRHERVRDRQAYRADKQSQTGRRAK
ncbi:MAG: ribosomal subunit interface protein [Omnitrophica bacterium RIFCSPHIGHO2_02_FULL_63_14]|nr:MAG: ribosomal subunit interface protein [Omnitrophica bacterium RIFCSPHIGHO2_02_FULL_63_14]